MLDVFFSFELALLLSETPGLDRPTQKFGIPNPNGHTQDSTGQAEPQRDSVDAGSLDKISAICGAADEGRATKKTHQMRTCHVKQVISGGMYMINHD